jgi:hypothetical protein
MLKNTHLYENIMFANKALYEREKKKDLGLIKRFKNNTRV